MSPTEIKARALAKLLGVTVEERHSGAWRVGSWKRVLVGIKLTCPEGYRFVDKKTGQVFWSREVRPGFRHWVTIWSYLRQVQAWSIDLDPNNIMPPFQDRFGKLMTDYISNVKKSLTNASFDP